MNLFLYLLYLGILIHSTHTFYSASKLPNLDMHSGVLNFLIKKNLVNYVVILAYFTPSYGDVKTCVFLLLEVSEVDVNKLHQDVSIQRQPECTSYQGVHKECD